MKGEGVEQGQENPTTTLPAGKQKRGLEVAPAIRTLNIVEKIGRRKERKKAA